MNMVTKTAIANMKYHKGKNVLTGIAIFLTSLLLLVVPTVGKDMIDIQFNMVNKTYPTWHALYRDVSEKQAEQLSAHHDISVYGLRSDVGCFMSETASVNMCYMDESAMELYKLGLQEGRMPEKTEEIVLSQGIIKELGVSAALGDTVTIPYQIRRDGGLGKKQERTFTLVGLLADSEEDLAKRSYIALVSKAFIQEEQGADKVAYNFLFQVTGDENVTTDAIEGTIKDIAEGFGIRESNTAVNTPYLEANYVDPAFLGGIIIIMIIIVLAGIITIYSIYYVSMIQRVQEFGKLKAIGTTKRQLKQLVLREGFAVAGIAMPVGLLGGSLLIKWILRLYSGFSNDNDMQAIIDSGEVQLLHGWIYILAIGVTLVTIYLSLLVPMRKAAKISEIEAMRYQGDKYAIKRKGMGYTFMNIGRLTKTYLAGNKKRNMITILSMSITGVFLLVIATVLSCANAEQCADYETMGQYDIYVITESGNQEHPEREWSTIMQNNPITDAMSEKIQALDGVENVDIFSSLEISCDRFEEGMGLCGVPEEYAKNVEKEILDGHVTYEELKSGDKVVLDNKMLYWYPELKLGDILHLQIKDGDRLIEKDVEIAAIGDYSIGFANFNMLIMAKEAIDNMVENNANSILHVYGEKRYDEMLEKALIDIISESGVLGMQSWQRVYETWKDNLTMISSTCYIFLGILSVICIMNLINTMMNSVYVRRKELGMLQAIGMTNKQLTAMLWQEGMFYTFGTLIISVGFGSVLGYPAYLWAKHDGLLSIHEYHYPWTAAIIVTVVMIVLQCVLAFVLSRSVQRDSLIERIRFSE
ncbi:MAG: FtsX-like permease family protein [Lachnospiraceae bacterium]|nr:FtsX-like permease family protein [Lachnospiraceae bacterium]